MTDRIAEWNAAMNNYLTCTDRTQELWLKVQELDRKMREDGVFKKPNQENKT